MADETIKRWNLETQQEEHIPEVDAFIKDIMDVYKKHNMAIAQEDYLGEFSIIVHRNDGYDDWLKRASWDPIKE